MEHFRKTSCFLRSEFCWTLFLLGRESRVIWSFQKPMISDSKSNKRNKRNKRQIPWSRKMGKSDGIPQSASWPGILELAYVFSYLKKCFAMTWAKTFSTKTWWCNGAMPLPDLLEEAKKELSGMKTPSWDSSFSGALRARTGQVPIH